MMKDPVRGRNCEHIEAFDRGSYMEYNSQLATRPFVSRQKVWRCPHCKSVAWPKDLVSAEALAQVLPAALTTLSEEGQPLYEHAVLGVDGRLCLPSAPSGG